jgi:hypothetical protein
LKKLEETIITWTTIFKKRLQLFKTYIRVLKLKNSIFTVQHFCYLWVQTCTTIFWLLTKPLIKVPHCFLTFMSQLSIIYLRIHITAQLLVAIYVSALSHVTIRREHVKCLMHVYKNMSIHKSSIKFNLAISFDLEG